LIVGKQGISTVTFDLWETLLFEKSGANTQRTAARCRHLANTLNKLGIETTVEQISLALEKTISKLLSVWETDRDISCVDQLQLIIRNATRDSATLKKEWINELTSAYIAPILEVPPYLNPDARKMLEQLRSMEKHIALICNTGLTPGLGLRRFLEEEGVAGYFDLMIFSEEVGIRKPDPKIFHMVTRKLSIKPNETVHVGDNLKTDVWGAKNAGFKTIHLSTEEGRDRTADSDPTSLVSLSRRLDNLKKVQAFPDKTIPSLAMAIEAIAELGT